MMGAQRGFTIIEVMIVLSISAILLVSAASVFGGRRQATEFSQAVYDIQSKFQSWASAVSSASIPGLESYTCSVNPSQRPVLDFSATATTGQDCIFLGMAIEVPHSNGSTIYAYPVFGLRSVYNSGVDSCLTTCIFPLTAADANPNIATDKTTGNPLLEEDYQLSGGVTIKSATINGGVSENDLLMLYSSLQNSNVSGNEISATSLTKTIASHSSSTVSGCVQDSCGSGPPIDLSNNTYWNLCVTDGTSTAKISISGTPSGITTNIDMNGSGC